MNRTELMSGGSVPGVGQSPGETRGAENRVGPNGATLFDRRYWTPSRIRAVTWRGLTLLTCPRCIPIWLWVLSGTAAGALLSGNLFITVALFLALFLYCFRNALRSYDQPGDTPGKEEEHGAS